jgi:hypothetical protein
MEPLRYNRSQLYGRPLYIGIPLVYETILISLFSATLSFPTEIHLSLNRVPEEKKLFVPILSIALLD